MCATHCSIRACCRLFFALLPSAVQLEDMPIIKQLLSSKLELCCEQQTRDGASGLCFPSLLPPATEGDPRCVLQLTSPTVCGLTLSCIGGIAERIPLGVFSTLLVRAMTADQHARVWSTRVIFCLSEGVEVLLERDALGHKIDVVVRADASVVDLTQMHDQAVRWAEQVVEVLREKAAGLRWKAGTLCYECIAAARLLPCIPLEIEGTHRHVDQLLLNMSNQDCQPLRCGAAQTALSKAKLCLEPRTSAIKSALIKKIMSLGMSASQLSAINRRFQPTASRSSGPATEGAVSYLGSDVVAEELQRWAAFMSHHQAAAGAFVKVLMLLIEAKLSQQGLRLRKIWTDMKELPTEQGMHDGAKFSRDFVLFLTTETLTRFWYASSPLHALPPAHQPACSPASQPAHMHARTHARTHACTRKGASKKSGGHSNIART